MKSGNHRSLSQLYDIWKWLCGYSANDHIDEMIFDSIKYKSNIIIEIIWKMNFKNSWGCMKTNEKLGSI